MSKNETLKKRQQEAAAYSGRVNVLVPVVAFSEAAVADTNVANSYWVQALTAGDFDHWLFGTVTLNEQRFTNMFNNFKSGVPQAEIAIDYEHGMDMSKGYQASGWLRDMRLTDERLDWLIEFTDTALEEIREKKWKYFSAEFTDLYEDNQSNLFLDVVLGGGLTNRPFLKGMQALNFSEVVIAEHAEEEHSDPGTGSPPEPRPQPDREQGYPHRKDTPPGGEETEEAVDLKKLFEALGLDVPENEEELTEEFALAKFSELKAEVEPLREARQAAESTVTFREQYPDEYDRLKKLETRDKEASAKEFSDRFVRFQTEDGETTKYGFSARVLELVEDSHLKLANRQFDTGDLDELLKNIGDNGIVEFGERGSSRAKDTKAVNENPKLAFSEVVGELMKEDGMLYAQAVKEAARREPELFAAYRGSTHGGS